MILCSSLRALQSSYALTSFSFFPFLYHQITSVIFTKNLESFIERSKINGAEVSGARLTNFAKLRGVSWASREGHSQSQSILPSDFFSPNLPSVRSSRGSPRLVPWCELVWRGGIPGADVLPHILRSSSSRTFRGFSFLLPSKEITSRFKNLKLEAVNRNGTHWK